MNSLHFHKKISFDEWMNHSAEYKGSEKSIHSQSFIGYGTHRPPLLQTKQDDTPGYRSLYTYSSLGGKGRKISWVDSITPDPDCGATFHN